MSNMFCVVSLFNFCLLNLLRGKVKKDFEHGCTSDACYWTTRSTLYVNCTLSIQHTMRPDFLSTNLPNKNNISNHLPVNISELWLYLNTSLDLSDTPFIPHHTELVQLMHNCMKIWPPCFKLRACTVHKWLMPNIHTCYISAPALKPCALAAR
jgi:hypothetical protein